MVLPAKRASGVGLEHYAKVLKEKPYVYTNDNIFPHDVRVHELGSGKSRLEMLAAWGIRGRVLPRSNIEDGIAAVRLLLPRCRFDSKKCDKGLEALRQYQKAWDDTRKDFMPRPLHDWTSHAADAFRYLAVGIKNQARENVKIQQRINAMNGEYDPLEQSFDY